MSYELALALETGSLGLSSHSLTPLSTSFNTKLVLEVGCELEPVHTPPGSSSFCVCVLLSFPLHAMLQYSNGVSPEQSLLSLLNLKKKFSVRSFCTAKTSRQFPQLRLSDLPTYFLVTLTN